MSLGLNFISDVALARSVPVVEGVVAILRG